tara:strand:- start:8 stop:220 length:213 start_codon:yes stop_codon:yes gene_type:complete
MKVGDLVWHKDDLRDDVITPGVVTGRDEHKYILVRFMDRIEVEEKHSPDELAISPYFDFDFEDENIMGNP